MQITTIMLYGIIPTQEILNFNLLKRLSRAVYTNLNFLNKIIFYSQKKIYIYYYFIIFIIKIYTYKR
jgi:hypothetical protein